MAPARFGEPGHGGNPDLTVTDQTQGSITGMTSAALP
jgi:hypothetical protein